MNRDEDIRRALHGIARADVPEHTNLWPRIAERIERKGAYGLKRKLKLSWVVVIVLIAFIAITTAAFAYYRLMIDPGLQAVENAGLITDLNQAAGATVFAKPSTPGAGTPQPSAASGAFQTLNGVSVILNWAYADESRVAFQITVSGLDLPDGSDPNDWICNPYITNDSGIHLNPTLSQIESLKDQPGKPIVLGYVSKQPLDANQHDHLKIDLDLTIGPCGPYWNFQENNLPKRTPFPLIGNYHLTFNVPVYKGVNITPNLTVEANGMSMRLESVTLNQSYIDVRLCYQPPGTSGMPAATDWMPEATIKIGEGKPVPNESFSDNTGKSQQLTYCADLGFATAYDGQPTTILVKVQRLFTNLPPVLSPELENSAQQKLSGQGIQVVFGDNGTGPDWNIVTMPAGMTDADAYQKVIDALSEKYEGPWVFAVEVAP